MKKIFITALFIIACATYLFSKATPTQMKLAKAFPPDTTIGNCYKECKKSKDVNQCNSAIDELEAAMNAMTINSGGDVGTGMSLGQLAVQTAEDIIQSGDDENSDPASTSSTQSTTSTTDGSDGLEPLDVDLEGSTVTGPASLSGDADSSGGYGGYSGGGSCNDGCGR